MKIKLITEGFYKEINIGLDIVYRYSSTRVLARGYYGKMTNTPSITVGAVGGYTTTGVTVTATKKEITAISNGAIILDITFDKALQEGNSLWTTLYLS